MNICFVIKLLVMDDDENKRSLCCCEFIDRNGERNHILACCCNCVELDLCVDRLVSCKGVGKQQLLGVMGACLDRLRCPARGGALSLTSFSYSILVPFVLQPVIAVATVSYVQNISLVVILVLLLKVFAAFYMAKRNALSQLLYYWTLASIVYSIFLFEKSITPLLEIRWDENMIVVLLASGALISLYLTRQYSSQNAAGELMNGSLMGDAESICPICRIKVYPRCVHCFVCHRCVPRYEHHCFWLDCCIGENNQVFFMAGLLMGSSSLLYSSLLTLTTVCRPVFKFGVLLPSDCSDVADDLELGVCYMCGVYCMGLSILAILQLGHHAWLVSLGLTAEEWRLQGYTLWPSNPFSRGFAQNWMQLLRGAAKLRR